MDAAQRKALEALHSSFTVTPDPRTSLPRVSQKTLTPVQGELMSKRTTNLAGVPGVIQPLPQAASSLGGPSPTIHVLANSQASTSSGTSTGMTLSSLGSGSSIPLVMSNTKSGGYKLQISSTGGLKLVSPSSITTTTSTTTTIGTAGTASTSTTELSRGTSAAAAGIGLGEQKFFLKQSADGKAQLYMYNTNNPSLAYLIQASDGQKLNLEMKVADMCSVKDSGMRIHPTETLRQVLTNSFTHTANLLTTSQTTQTGIGHQVLQASATTQGQTTLKAASVQVSGTNPKSKPPTVKAILVAKAAGEPTSYAKADLTIKEQVELMRSGTKAQPGPVIVYSNELFGPKKEQSVFKKKHSVSLLTHKEVPATPSTPGDTQQTAAPEAAEQLADKSSTLTDKQTARIETKESLACNAEVVSKGGNMTRLQTSETESADTEETESADTEETESANTEETESANTEETESANTEEEDPPMFKIDAVFSLAPEAVQEVAATEATGDSFGAGHSEDKPISVEEFYHKHCNSWEDFQNNSESSFVVLEQLSKRDIGDKGQLDQSKCSHHCRKRTLDFLCMTDLIKCPTKHKTRVKEEHVNVKAEVSEDFCVKMENVCNDTPEEDVTEPALFENNAHVVETLGEKHIFVKKGTRKVRPEAQTASSSAVTLRDSSAARSSEASSFTVKSILSAVLKERKLSTQELSLLKTSGKTKAAEAMLKTVDKPKASQDIGSSSTENPTDVEQERGVAVNAPTYSDAQTNPFVFVVSPSNKDVVIFSPSDKDKLGSKETSTGLVSLLTSQHSPIMGAKTVSPQSTMQPQTILVTPKGAVLTTRSVPISSTVLTKAQTVKPLSTQISSTVLTKAQTVKPMSTQISSTVLTKTQTVKPLSTQSTVQTPTILVSPQGSVLTTTSVPISSTVLTTAKTVLPDSSVLTSPQAVSTHSSAPSPAQLVSIHCNVLARTKTAPAIVSASSKPGPNTDAALARSASTAPVLVSAAARTGPTPNVVLTPNSVASGAISLLKNISLLSQSTPSSSGACLQSMAAQALSGGGSVLESLSLKPRPSSETQIHPVTSQSAQPVTQAATSQSAVTVTSQSAVTVTQAVTNQSAVTVTQTVTSQSASSISTQAVTKAADQVYALMLPPAQPGGQPQIVLVRGMQASSSSGQTTVSPSVIQTAAPTPTAANITATTVASVTHSPAVATAPAANLSNLPQWTAQAASTLSHQPGHILIRYTFAPSTSAGSTGTKGSTAVEAVSVGSTAAPQQTNISKPSAPSVTEVPTATQTKRFALVPVSAQSVLARPTQSAATQLTATSVNKPTQTKSARIPGATSSKIETLPSQSGAAPSVCYVSAKLGAASLVSALPPSSGVSTAATTGTSIPIHWAPLLSAASSLAPGIKGALKSTTQVLPTSKGVLSVVNMPLQGLSTLASSSSSTTTSHTLSQGSTATAVIVSGGSGSASLGASSIPVVKPHQLNKNFTYVVRGGNSGSSLLSPSTSEPQKQTKKNVTYVIKAPEDKAPLVLSAVDKIISRAQSSGGQLKVVMPGEKFSKSAGKSLIVSSVKELTSTAKQVVSGATVSSRSLLYLPSFSGISTSPVAKSLLTASTRLATMATSAMPNTSKVSITRSLIPNINKSSMLSQCMSAMSSVPSQSTSSSASTASTPSSSAALQNNVTSQAEQARKLFRARLEQRYPLPPGVVIKTEPDADFGCPTGPDLTEEDPDDDDDDDDLPVSFAAPVQTSGQTFRTSTASHLFVSTRIGLRPDAENTSVPPDLETFEAGSRDDDDTEASQSRDSRTERPQLNQPANRKGKTNMKDVRDPYGEPPVLEPIYPLGSNQGDGLSERGSIALSRRKRKRKYQEPARVDPDYDPSEETRPTEKAKKRVGLSVRRLSEVAELVPYTWKGRTKGTIETQGKKTLQRPQFNSPSSSDSDDAEEDPLPTPPPPSSSSSLSLLSAYSSSSLQTPSSSTPSSSSSDRIQALKEMLRQQNEHLEKIRRERAQQPMASDPSSHT